MQFELTAEWVIVIIVVLVVLLCTPLLCTKPRRSGVVVPEAEPDSKGPRAPRTQGPPPPPADPPPPPPPDVPDLPDLPPLLRWIPPRPEPMDPLPGPLDAVPKAPAPVSRRSTGTSDVSSFASSSACRTSRCSSSQPYWHQGVERVGGPIDTQPLQPRPNFCGSVQFHAGRCGNIPVHRGRSCFALGPTLQPQLPLHTRSGEQELQTQSSESSTAWKQRIPVMCQTLHSELVPQPLLDRKGPCDLESLPASLHTLPRCQSVCPIVGRPTITMQPQELQSLSQRPASDTPAPALWQPRVRLILPQQKPVGTERAMRAMQTLEFLPKPPEMLQRWCRKSAPHLLPADPRPACPVSGARPRPLRATDLLPLSMPKLKPRQPSAGDAADLDPITKISVYIVQPGPMIWRSHAKEPSWCTSVQLRKPETPEWPINGNPHGPKRPETEPGLVTPATPPIPSSKEPEKPEEPEEPEESTEDFGATERRKTPTPRATPKATPKAKAQRGARGAGATGTTRDATKETESSKTRSASSGKTQDKSGTLDSTLGGPSHGWKKGGTRRAGKEGTPGPGHYSPKHAGVHGRSH